jgi:cell division protein FtsI/penicillin-binding protein 2
MPRRRSQSNELAFEDSLSDDWGHDLTMVEVPLGNKPLWALGFVVGAIVLTILGRVIFLNASNAYYVARAAANVAQGQSTPAPRGMIYDREGNGLVANKAVFAAYLDAHQFFSGETIGPSGGHTNDPNYFWHGIGYRVVHVEPKPSARFLNAHCFE